MVTGKGRFVCKDCGHESDMILLEYCATSIVIPMPNFCHNCGSKNIEPTDNWANIADGEAHVLCKDCGISLYLCDLGYSGLIR